MKKALRISLSILVPFILNFFFLIYTTGRQGICISNVYGYEKTIQDGFLFLYWTLAQAAIIFFILKRSKYKRQLIGLPVTSFLFVVIFGILSYSLIDYQPQEFDQEEWINHDMYYHTRVYYVEDLIWNEKLNGMCYDEIIAFLGKPESIEKDHFEYKIYQGTFKVFLEDSCFKEIKVECEKGN